MWRRRDVGGDSSMSDMLNAIVPANALSLPFQGGEHLVSQQLDRLPRLLDRHGAYERVQHHVIERILFDVGDQLLG